MKNTIHKPVPGAPRQDMFEFPRASLPVTCAARLSCPHEPVARGGNRLEIATATVEWSQQAIRFQAALESWSAAKKQALCEAHYAQQLAPVKGLVGELFTGALTRSEQQGRVAAVAFLEAGAAASRMVAASRALHLDANEQDQLRLARHFLAHEAGNPE
jgi:hypothetical protein